MDKLQVGDIVEYRANKSAPVSDEDTTGYIGVVSEVTAADGSSPELAKVEWIYSPNHNSYRICYQLNLRKLGEVQHG